MYICYINFIRHSAVRKTILVYTFPLTFLVNELQELNSHLGSGTVCLAILVRKPELNFGQRVDVINYSSDRDTRFEIGRYCCYGGYGVRCAEVISFRRVMNVMLYGVHYN